jgi:signal transduction histidine kinase/CheY-like chemotaxis protein
MPDLGWILDNLPLGVWVARAPEGVVAYSNPAFEAILGIAAVPDSPIEDAPATYNIFDRSGMPYPVEKLPFSQALAQRTTVTVDDVVIHRRARARHHGGAPGARSEPRADRDLDRGHGRHRWTVGRRRPGFDGRQVRTIGRAEPVRPVSGTPDDSRLTCGAGFRERLSGTRSRSPARSTTRTSRLRDAEGAVTGVVALSNDVTELRRLQASAIQNDRVIALGTLAASVAHEINNPLTYLLSHAEMCERRLERLEQALAALPAESAQPLRPLVNQLRADLDPVRSAGERIARITRQLKTFSRSSDERREVIDMKDVVRSVLALVGKDVEACAKVRLELAERVYVFADEARLVQVVLNLVVNAKQAVQAKKRSDGKITIVAQRQADRVLLDVEDNGPGVPAHHRDQIFDPFFTTKEPGEGTGLGLFVCRNIVRELGGDISIEDPPGGGARFRITLAAHGEAPSVAPAAKPPSIPTASPAGSAKIMLIDDEPLLLRALSQALRSAGHEVTPIDDGAAALEILVSDRPFDLIFCDVMMRGLTGIDLLQVLKERAPERVRRIVFMSGGAYTPEAREFLDEYSAQSVDKPFDPVREARARLKQLAEDS